jgi:hypothetical protein
MSQKHCCLEVTGQAGQSMMPKANMSVSQLCFQPKALRETAQRVDLVFATDCCSL